MSNKQAAAYINLEIYEDSINLLGVAKVQLSAIVYPCVTYPEEKNVPKFQREPLKNKDLCY